MSNVLLGLGNLFGRGFMSQGPAWVQPLPHIYYQLVKEAVGFAQDLFLPLVQIHMGAAVPILTDAQDNEWVCDCGSSALGNLFGPALCHQGTVHFALCHTAESHVTHVTRALCIAG